MTNNNAGRLATPGYELGLFEQGDYFDIPDLNKWFAKWAPWVPQGTIPKVFSVDGGEAPVPCTNPNDCGGESLVGMLYLMPCPCLQQDEELTITAPQTLKSPRL